MKYHAIFEPYSGPYSRHICPKCQDSKKSFVLYLDSESKQPISPIVGKCNREIKCGYNYTRSDFIRDHGNPSGSFAIKKALTQKEIELPPSFIPFEVFKAGFDEQMDNHFKSFLITNFGKQRTNEIFQKYYIGTSNKWPGATIFWQIDQNHMIRTGKIMLYDQTTGKRVKSPNTYLSWVHKGLNIADFNLCQCFFGEHLLLNDKKPVAIVESEKTACIASIYYPKFIWLASGGITGLTEEKCKVLNGRKVTLFPDLGAYKKWKIIANAHNYAISDYLERIANDDERNEGLDIADFLLKCNFEIR